MNTASTDRRVLLASELGGGRGHLTRLAAIATELLSRGHRLRLLTPDATSAASVFDSVAGGNPRFDIRVVPKHRLSGSATRPTYTMADELARLGFADLDSIGAHLGWWCHQVDDWRPGLVIADFSPSACLASAGRVPTVSVGNGYAIPPDLSPLPSLRPWQDHVPSSSHGTEARLVEVLAHAARRFERRPPTRLAQVFRGDAAIVTTWPWFDPYQAHRTEPVYPPFNVGSSVAPMRFAERTPRSVFAYLPSGSEDLKTVCAVAAAERLGGTVFLGDRASPPDSLPDGLDLAGSAPDLGHVLPTVRLAIHHAGLGTAGACLLAGTPQVVFPNTLEHHITAHGLRRLGVAAVFSTLAPATVDQIRESIAALHRIAETEDRFAALAMEIRKHASNSGLDAILRLAGLAFSS